MRNRYTNKELQNILLLLYIMKVNQDFFVTGLCQWCYILYFNSKINYNEFELLSNYIKQNRPSKFSSLNAFKNRKDGFYWKRGDIEPRLKWINKHIKKIEKELNK